MLIRRCGWCKKVYGVKFYINPGQSNLASFLQITIKNILVWQTTHGICDNCVGLLKRKKGELK